jgi:rhodanese-related sulfurtransferase
MKILREGVVVAFLGMAFASAANALSPRGLALARNYFPGATPGSTAPVTLKQGSGTTGTTNHPSPSDIDALAARLKAKGLELADSNHVIQWFQDPRYDQELVVFVDSRDDEHYQAGHIPGAWQLDHFHPDRHLATVLPVCQTAENIVVYCMGGDCEDSEFAALTLAELGIPKDKLRIYGGGMSEWIANGWPVEIEARKSGRMLQTAPGTTPGAP